MSRQIDNDDTEAARWLGEEVERLGGQLTIHGSTLLELFLAFSFNQEDSYRITQALADEGLRTSPTDISGLATSQEITVSQNDAPEPEEPGQEQAAEPPPTPESGPTPAEALAEQAAAVPSGAIAAGILIPGILSAVVGAAIWLPFGLLFLGLSLGMWLAFGRFRFWFSRIFFWRLPSVWFTGLLLALLPMLIATAVVSAAVVAPIAGKRAADKRHDQALALITRANDEFRDGDLDAARVSLEEARDRDSDVDGDDDLEREISDEEQRREDYERATLLLDKDDPRGALVVFRELGDYRDSQQLRTKARNALARQQLLQAESYYTEGRYEEARQEAALSLRTRRTKAAIALRSKANRRIAEERAAERAREQRLAAERQARREAAERARKARQAQEEAEARALEESYSTPAAPDSSGSYCASGTPYPQYPGQRDGDGDGCWGE